MSGVLVSLRLAKKDKPMLLMKKTVASMAVVLDRNEDAPRAPNSEVDAPPKPAPASAPRPCCSMTNPTIASATRTWMKVNA